MLIAKCGESALGVEEESNWHSFLPHGTLIVSSIDQKLCHLKIISIVWCYICGERFRLLLVDNLLNKKDHAFLILYFLINLFIFGCIGSSLLHAGFL